MWKLKCYGHKKTTTKSVQFVGFSFVCMEYYADNCCYLLEYNNTTLKLFSLMHIKIDCPLNLVGHLTHS